ncbi:hypothetical protein [Candidatus Methanocrinis natronophilus]|uniref:Uncharacterized protein n=1 Tax=Candidatus Methanocrinis natronophilus TaxID=3033396 RepID=A0ABT5X545_9EURY|nr:hypothetical protein [Candidatus Methanocrinis natronophilus]MDF0589816.1 hypothetical protein [Candidatus Methanocrinis natronophilus]
MSGRSSRNDIPSSAAFSVIALILIISIPASATSGLEANLYGEVVMKKAASEPAPPEGVPGAAAASGEVASPGTGASEVSASEDAGPEDPGEVSTEPEPPGTKIGEAVVYVFNRDDKTLSVSLFIGSELKGTENILRDRETKFGHYPLEAGAHTFRITWWDDLTKKVQQEEVVAVVDGITPVTLYTTRSTGPAKFDITVMLRNDNKEDLEAYLFINDEYDRMRTARKESTTDLGRINIEEGIHVLAVRWQDPETKIEYENRRTVRVDGRTVVTFYAPRGMAFETEEKADPKTVAPRAATAAAAQTPASPPEKEVTDERIPARAAATDPKDPPPEADLKDGGDLEDGPSDGGRRILYLSTIGAILVIYIIFFRR